MAAPERPRAGHRRARSRQAAATGQIHRTSAWGTRQLSANACQLLAGRPPLAARTGRRPRRQMPSASGCETFHATQVSSFPGNFCAVKSLITDSENTKRSERSTVVPTPCRHGRATAPDLAPRAWTFASSPRPAAAQTEQLRSTRVACSLSLKPADDVTDKGPRTSLAAHPEMTPTWPACRTPRPASLIAGEGRPGPQRLAVHTPGTAGENAGNGVLGRGRREWKTARWPLEDV